MDGWPVGWWWVSRVVGRKRRGKKGREISAAERQRKPSTAPSHSISLIPAHAPLCRPYLNNNCRSVATPPPRCPSFSAPDQPGRAPFGTLWRFQPNSNLQRNKWPSVITRARAAQSRRICRIRPQHNPERLANSEPKEWTSSSSCGPAQLVTNGRPVGSRRCPQRGHSSPGGRSELWWQS